MACFSQTVEREPVQVEQKPQLVTVPTHKQLLLVKSETWLSNKAVLTRYQWVEETGWASVGEEIPVLLATGGMAWGIGLYDVPQEKGEAQKREGDYRSPAGIFRLESSFGLTRKKMINWDFSYQESYPNLLCITDPSSSFYNQIVNQQKVEHDWEIHQPMRGSGQTYKWGIVIEQNSKNEPQKGACIFLHVWRSEGKGTAVGTAMSERDIIEIIPWLKGENNPILVQGTTKIWPRILTVLLQNGISLPKK